ncbi:MAG: hypothetical protein EBV63_06050, partial [Actinobacteria bacterium]|nr:hypothetical protein [Actinomycetota bacterium]
MQIRELKDNFLGFSSDQKKGLIAVSLVAITFSVFLFLTTRGSAIAQESPKPVLSISPIQSTILIHVAGKVKTPGV